MRCRQMEAALSPRLGVLPPTGSIHPSHRLWVFLSCEQQFSFPSAEGASPRETEKLSGNLETDAYVHFFL